MIFHKVLASRVSLYSKPMILINPLIDIIIDRSFIIDFLTCWVLFPCFRRMVNTLFFCVSFFIVQHLVLLCLIFSCNQYLLSPSILLHWSYRQGCSLAPHLSLLTFDALGYFLDVTLAQGKIQRISIRDGYEMANNDFAHDFFCRSRWTKS